MKQIYLKMLVAIALVLAGSSANAQDKNYSQVFKYTYEDAATLTEGLTIGPGTTTSQYNIEADAYLKI